MQLQTHPAESVTRFRDGCHGPDLVTFRSILSNRQLDLGTHLQPSPGCADLARLRQGLRDRVQAAVQPEVGLEVLAVEPPPLLDPGRRAELDHPDLRAAKRPYRL